MTTTVQTAISGPYTLSGGTTVAVTFQSTGDDEISVLLNGEEVSSGDYVFDRDEDGTGTVTFNSATTGTVYVASSPSFSQEADFQAFGSWSPHYINTHLDRAARRDIYLKSEIDRALKMPVGASVPTYEEFALAFKGDPGGSTESVGLFSTLAAGLTEIPAGIDTVQTSGNLVLGIGRGVYIRHEDVDEAYVAANPLTSFMTVGIVANLGFKLASDWITPWMFGATGRNDLQDWVFGADMDEVLPVDNAAAIQACLDYAASEQRKMTVDLRGIWGVTDHDADGVGLIIDQPRTNGQTFIGGTFIVLGTMVDLFQSTIRTSNLFGTWALHGAPSNRELSLPYAQRLAENGWRSMEAGTAYIQEIRASNFKNFGVLDHTSGNNIMLKIGMIWGESCGSQHIYDGRRVLANFTTRTDTGGNAEFNQLSVLGGISDTTEFRAGSLVHITGTNTVHYVRTKTSNSLSVYPWLPHVDEEDDPITSGEVISMHGGLVSFTNNDSTSVEIDRIDGFHCGVLIRSGGLYGLKVNNWQAQVCSVSVMLGDNTTGEGKVNRATHLGRAHSEANSYDLVQVSPGSFWEVGEVSSWGSDGDPSLFSRTIPLVPRFNSGTLGGILSYGAGLQGSFRYRGRTYYSIGTYNGNRNDGGDTVRNYADGRPYVYRADNFTVSLEWDASTSEVWHNAGWVQVIIVGTGTNRAPSGTVTVQPTTVQAADGYTVNGAASVAITSQPGRVNVIAILEPGSKNWLVSW